MAKAAGSARLRADQLDPATGKVTWPPLLESDEFAASRADLEGIFARRAANGKITARQRAQVQQTAKAMLGRLREQIQDAPPMDYTAAKRFLQSLAYEVQ